MGSPRRVLVSSQIGQQPGPPPLMDQRSTAQKMPSKLTCDFSGVHGHRKVFCLLVSSSWTSFLQHDLRILEAVMLPRLDAVGVSPQR